MECGSCGKELKKSFNKVDWKTLDYNMVYTSVWCNKCLNQYKNYETWQIINVETIE